MTKQEVFLRLTTVLGCSGQLEVPCTRLAHPSKEIERVTSPLLVELGWHILELVYDFGLFLLGVILADLEGTWFLCKEVCVILNCFYEPFYG